MAQSFHQKKNGGLLLLRNVSDAGGLPAPVLDEAMWCALGDSILQNDRIVTKTKKSGDMVEVSIPIDASFRQVLDTITHNHLNLIVTAYGSARSDKAFTNWIIEAAREAALRPHRSPHRLRKAACIRLTQAG
ncbi:hypothetical protein HFN01_08605 [Rhizobium leguminosarum]|uniref:YdcP family protein n=1 Tax=Rhizobium leguminosarum TaxID=384 RepID=UPI001C93E2F0|nr:YdcP family protein [Rhizobium leguminosarum]MBY5394888.1 hypothetical protein [Rhizobium leguminosarum]